MALMEPTEAQPLAPPRRLSLFALGFRPFFLLAGVAALVLVPLWAAAYVGGLTAPAHYGGIGWHAHEMLFGYTLAVIAGFLLTAVRNWTGVDTVTGTGLMLLAALWLAGRIAPFLPLPGALVTAVDLAFVPALAVAIGVPLVKGGQRHNLIFLGFLTLLFVANVLMHRPETWRAGTDLALGVILLIVIVVGGRVVPFFIERGLPPGATPRQWPRLEQLAIAATVLWVVVRLAAPGTGVHVAVALFAAAVHGVRVGAWFTRGVFRVPLLWVLLFSFVWLAVGFLLDALAALGALAPSIAVHAFTAGTIGGLTLGMMSRVSLGHTGREMRSARAIDVAFGLVNIAALTRVIGPLLLPSAYTGWIHLSATIWAIAFLLFVIVYAPILAYPRVDGRPG